MIEVTQYKLDNPGNKYEWWKKVKQIHTEDDMEKIFGVCGMNVYGYISNPGDDSDADLRMDVEDVLRMMNTRSSKDIVDIYFKVTQQLMDSKLLASCSCRCHFRKDTSIKGDVVIKAGEYNALR